MTKKTNSPLAWLAGANKPNALGYVAIDPQRWAAMVKEMDKAAAKEKAARRSPPMSRADRRDLRR